jgi:DNA topoisomerase IB
MPRLRNVDTSIPGLGRRRNGRGFVYLDARRRPIDDESVLERIRALAIPPAWDEVWVCPYPNGHIQAVGTDAAGRRQYLYHAAWRARRDEEKFERLLDFAKGLDRLRKRVGDALALEGVPRERVLAAAVRLLDLGFFRIGGEQYAEDNETFGLATLQRRHVRLLPNGALLFDYVGKGGKRQRHRIVDKDVHEVLARLKRRRTGGELLAWKEGDRWRDVRSDDVNGYIKELAGEGFTAKYFRTWNATVLAATAVAVYGQAATSPIARSHAIVQTVREVAHYLGNTPAVCRSSYVDPRVFERFELGLTIAAALEDLEDLEAATPDLVRRSRIERAVLELVAG